MNIPTINLDSKAVSTDVLSTYLSDLRGLAREQLKLITSNGTNYGVVAASDPTVQTTGENPLWVAIGSSNTKVKVYTGSAVTLSGDVVTLDTETEVGLAVVSEGSINVVFLYLECVTNPKRVLGSNGVMAPTGSHYETKLTVLSKAAYLALASDVRKSGCALALVTYYADGSEVTYTDSSLAWLRPWFSSVDIAHRSLIGSGTATTTNPHATTIGDIVDSSGMSIYRQMTRSGMIWSPDSSTAGIPGYLCTATYAASDFLVDSTGEVTKGSIYGGSGVYYLKLNSYVTFISRVMDLTALSSSTSTEGDYQYIVDLIPGSRILVFVTDSAPTVGVKIHYHHTPTLEITSETSGSLTFSGIDSSEEVITEGLALTDVTSSTVFVRKYNGIPCKIQAVIKKSGKVVLDPAVLEANVSPATATTLTTVSAEFTNPCYIGIGATKLGTSDTQVLTVTLIGTDVDGNALTETISLTPDTWSDTVDVIASADPLNQILWSTSPFASLTSYQVTTNTSNDASGYFQVYTKLDPARAHVATIATFFWNKREMKDIRDARRILPVVRDGLYGVTSVTSLGELITASNLVLNAQASSTQAVQLIISEDFQQPRYLDAESVIWNGRDILEASVIPSSITDSSIYTNCYRSRMVPINKQPQQLCYIIIVLHNADSSKQETGAVRFVLENYDNVYEASALLLSGDATKRIYLGLVTASDSASIYRGISFVITGKCQGFSAYFVVPTQTVSTTYTVTPTKLSYTRYTGD